MRVAVVIPALNEEGSIGRVIEQVRSAVIETGAASCDVVVGDNGSTDKTAIIAKAAGASVVHAARRGYGSACQAALATLAASTEVVLFADGDGADDPSDIAALLAPLKLDVADLVIGSRALGERLGLAEEGSLSRPQRFGNRLATTLLRLIYGVHFSDLGPFRAIRKEALDQLAMDDPDFGWTVQMQARAARAGLRVREVAVHYRRRREGVSKVSGDVKGSALAGAIILRTLALEASPRRAALRRGRHASRGRGASSSSSSSSSTSSSIARLSGGEKE